MYNMANLLTFKTRLMKNMQTFCFVRSASVHINMKYN